MAPLTWRNVDDPDLGKAAAILESAARNFEAGFGGLGENFQNMHGIQSRNRSAAAMSQLAGITGGANVDEILARVSGSVDPMYRTDELNAAILNARGTGLGYDDTNSAIAARNAGNARSQETHDWDMGVRRQEAAIADDVLRRAAAANGGVAVPANMDSRELLARTLQAEAGGEGYDGMLAAGATIANRVNQGAYGGTIEGNILAPGQFSAWNGVTGYAGGEGALDMVNMTPSEQAYAVADAILSGNYQDPTGGATHYYNPEAANPAWGAGAGGNWTRIGNHVFGTAEGGLPTGGGRTSVADLIPEGNMISYRDWMEIEQDIYNDGQEVIADGFENRRSARTEREEIRSAAEDEQTRQRQAQADEIVGSMIDGLGPNAAVEGIDAIMGMTNIDDATKQLAVASLRTRIDEMPEFFNAAGATGMTPMAEAAMAQMGMNEQIIDSQNGTLRALESVGISFDMSAGDADAAVTGEGASPDSQGQGLLEQLNGLMENAETLQITDDPERILGIVQDIAGELKLDPRLVMAMAQDSFSENTMGLGMSLDADILRQKLEGWADPDSRRQLIEEQRQQALRREELEGLIAAQQVAQTEIDVFSRRSGPNAEARVEAALEESKRVDQAIEALMARDNTANGIVTPDRRSKRQEEPAPATTDEIVTADSDDRRQAILEAETRPTPGGRTVDPEASGFDQAVSRVMRDSEISATLNQIQTGLATGGGAPINRMIGGVTDFFRPRAEAEANQANREEKRQALRWFQSEEAMALFWTNPELLAEAQEDPVAFWQSRQESDEESE